jgi:polar amino acid transport system substrate-binding protein
MTVRPDREEMVNFTIKYVKSAQYVLINVNNTTVATAEDLKGKTIGVQMGTTGDFFASDEIEGATVVPYNDAVTASLDLANGRIDAVITDELPAKNIAASNENLKVLDLVLTEEEYAIAIAKEKTDLLEAVNKTLNRLIEEGKIASYINTHMGLGNIAE